MTATRQIAIRAFDVQDGALYRDLRLRALAESPDAFSRTLAEEKNRPDAEWSQRLANWARSPLHLGLVAFLDERSVGLAFVALETEAQVTQLYSMWVDPAARQLGIGNQLLQRSVNWSRQCRARKMKLQVTESNTAALQLYARAGFLPTAAVEPLRVGSALTAHTMELEL